MTHDKAEQPAQSESELLPDSEDDFEPPSIDVETSPVDVEPPDDVVQDDGADVELDDDTSQHPERDTR